MNQRNARIYVSVEIDKNKAKAIRADLYSPGKVLRISWESPEKVIRKL